MREIRTDMALEAMESANGELKGVKVDEETLKEGIHVSRVSVLSKEGGEALGKAMGNYITVDCEDLVNRDRSVKDVYARCVAGELKKMVGTSKEGPTLIIGLGNREVTPDALGPKVCENVFVTRHIKKYVPEAIDERTANVCAIAPGVLGVTGLETEEVVKGIVKEVKPSMIIAIDSLAARAISRIGSSVQLSDTGISPGAGIGNNRKALNQESLGVPVIALGVPMVTYAYTIAGDLIEAAMGPDVEDKNIEQFIGSVMSAKGSELIVTPKDIDVLIEKASEIIGMALNMALSPKLKVKEIEEYMS